MQLRQIYKPIENDLAEVRQEIKRLLKMDDSFMWRLMEDIFDSSGKLLRSALALFSFSAGRGVGRNKGEIIKAASVIELIHTATLIHDDLIDGTTLRRHKQAFHTKWGDKISVLFGDYLFSRSFTTLCELGHPEIDSALANTLSLICEGELKQISRAYDWDLSEEEYLSIIEMKTASLFWFSCFCGGNLGEVGSEIEALTNYGVYFGIVFQMVDDCLDYVGREEEVGKSLGSDLRKGKVTLPLIYLLASVPERLRKEVIKFVSSEQQNVSIPIIKEMVSDHQIMHRCAKRVMEYLEKARIEAKRIKNRDVKKSLIDICDYISINPLKGFRGLGRR